MHQTYQSMAQTTRPGMSPNLAPIAHKLTTPSNARDIRQLKLLSKVCRSADECIDLGAYQHIFEDYFEHFNNFNYIMPKMTVIMNKGEGTNGSVMRVTYMRRNMYAYCVYKIANNDDSDNLFYEYWVGKYFVNRCCEMFPTFLKTYGLYAISTRIPLNKFFADAGTNPKLYRRVEFDFQSNVVPNEACSENERLLLNIQHYGRFITFEKAMFHPEGRSVGMQFEMATLLFQVYFALSSLGDTYTHYDLHTTNVGIYSPYTTSEYILMHYHMPDSSVISFPTRYIAKIIDYGRNYVRFNDHIDSQTFMEKVCNTQACAPNCGRIYGIFSREGNVLLKKAFHIDPTIPNISFDLRLLACAMVHQREFNEAIPNHGLTLYFSLNGGPLDPTNKADYGTPEKKDSVFTPTNRVIHTVHDAMNALAFFLQTEPIIMNRINQKYLSTSAIGHKATKVADLHVWYDQRPYTYTPVDVDETMFDKAHIPPPVSPSSRVPPVTLRAIAQQQSQASALNEQSQSPQLSRTTPTTEATEAESHSPVSSLDSTSAKFVHMTISNKPTTRTPWQSRTFPQESEAESSTEKMDVVDADMDADRDGDGDEMNTWLGVGTQSERTKPTKENGMFSQLTNQVAKAAKATKRIFTKGTMQLRSNKNKVVPKKGGRRTRRRRRHRRRTRRRLH